MCLVALAVDCHPRWRLIVAGNRDEWHDRPADPLAWWQVPRIAAGRDRQAGGTWMAVGPGGRCAVVTNVRDGHAAPAGGPSRGYLAVAFLDGSMTAAAHAAALAAQAHAYAPFNLVLADGTGCHYIGNHPRVRHRALGAGVHALSNGDLDAPWPKSEALRAGLAAWVAAGASDHAPLWAALADEQVAPDAALPDTGVGLALERALSPAFIRGRAYGTRASTLAFIDRAGAGHVLERRFAPGGHFIGETTLAVPG